MAYVQTARRGAGAFGRIRSFVDGWKEDSRRYRIYRQTIDELSPMSDRDLADLGISRLQIVDIAREAAGLR